MAAAFCRPRPTRAGGTSATRSSGRPGEAQAPPGDPVHEWLEENLESDIDGAAALEQVDGGVQVDVVARSKDEGALGVVTGALELLVPPLLDAIDLGRVHQL